MTRSRDMADAGAIINHLDNVSSDIQTQIASVDVDRFSAATKTANITLDTDTHYLSGLLTVNNGVTMTIPADTLLELKLYTTGKAL
jgi:hypothetical protein